MRTCNCPNCNANLTIDDANREFTFCQYCGTKIMLDDYRSTHRVIDEAKIKQAEVEREIRLRELKIEEAQMNQRNQLRKVLTYIWIGLILAVALLCLFIWATVGGLVAFICLFFVGGSVVRGGAHLVFKVIPEKEIEKELVQNGGIRFPKNLGDLSEQNYVVIQQKLLSAGFCNITCINMHDVTFGLIQKPGMVESITVNGEKVVSGGKIYMADVPIVITYHGK